MSGHKAFLDCYKILDLSGRLGWLAGRILADLGAEVIKVEAPEYDCDDPDWRAGNINKKVLELDILGDAGRQVIETMIPGVDVLIQTVSCGQSALSWLDPDQVAARNPNLIHVVISPFGAKGPRSHWKGTDIEMMAASGAMSLMGERGGTPLRISVPQSYNWAGAQAAIGALVALNHRGSGGAGQVVDVSAQAAIVTALAHAPTFADLAGTVPTRAGSFITGRSNTGAVFRAFWKCKDGYINFVLYGGPAGRRTNMGLVSWMKESGAEPGILADVDWDTFNPTGLAQDEVERYEAPISTFFEGLTKQQFLEEACRRDMLGYPVSTVADISTDPQLDARGFWQDSTLADGNSERHCGTFYIADKQRPPLNAVATRFKARYILRDFGFSDNEIDTLVKLRVLQAA